MIKYYDINKLLANASYGNNYDYDYARDYDYDYDYFQFRIVMKNKGQKYEYHNTSGLCRFTHISS